MEAKVSPDIAMKKAILLAGGAVRLPKDFRLPFPPSKSTAGPGAGSASIVFSFGNTRAKKAISREAGEFELVVKRGSLSILREGEVLVKGVEMIPTLLHAPYQAFVNMDNSCMMACKFCASPRLGPHGTKDLTDEKIMSMILEASKQPSFEAVALTSGVAEDPARAAERMANLVRKVREALPMAPIGVEPYVTRPNEVDALKEAGADEIKINIETFDRDLFEKICPKRDYDTILHMINHACEVFGRNRVCSNIIFGFGESDENVMEGVKVLGNMGAVATLRALRKNDYNIEELEAALGPLKPVTPDRMLRLAEMEKQVLKGYGLSTLSFETMCYTCLSCDIVPFWDV